MKITNIASGPRGFWHGPHLMRLAPGESIERDLSEQDAAGVRGNPESFSVEGESAPQPPAQTDPQALHVHDKGRGWFVIMDGDEEVTKSLRADDVEEFDSLSDEDKAAFVDLHKAD